MMFKVLIVASSALMALAYYPPKKDSVLASVYTGGYGNVPAAVNYGLASAAPKVQVTYGSINKVPAEVKQKSYTASSSYGAVPEQGNVVREEKQVKQPPSLSYAGYGPTEAEVKQPKPNVQVSIKSETPEPVAPKQPYGGSYGANVEAESRVTERVITKPPVTQPPVMPQKPVVPNSSYGSIYGGVETKDQNVKETKLKVKPPPITSYGAYGSVGNKVEENIKQQATTLPPPPPPAASNYGNVISGYGQPVKEVSATTQLVTEAQQTTKLITIPSSYDQYIAPKKDSVAAKLPTGYGIVPESAGSSVETKKISVPLQPLPSSYGSLAQWKKDQVPKETQLEQKQDQAEESQDQTDDDEKIDGNDDRTNKRASEEEASSPLASSSTMLPTTATSPEPSSSPVPTSAEDNNEIREPTASPAPPMPECIDKNEYCDYWKEKNECEQNPAYMQVNCPIACGTCQHQRKFLLMQELQNGEI